MAAKAKVQVMLPKMPKGTDFLQHDSSTVLGLSVRS